MAILEKLKSYFRLSKAVEKSDLALIEKNLQILETIYFTPLGTNRSFPQNRKIF